MSAVRVLIVDDQPQFRELAQEVLDATEGSFRPAGFVQSGEAAQAWLEGNAADLVVMDVRMPGAGGVAAAQAMAKRPDRPVVVLCSSDEWPEIAADPAAHGADAFYTKDRLGPRLLREIWAAFGCPRPAR